MTRRDKGTKKGISPETLARRTKRPEDLKRGEWQPGDTKPSMPGVYERDYSKAGYSGEVETQWSRWDGKNWRLGSIHVKKAGQQWGVSLEQKIPWRGQIEVKP